MSKIIATDCDGVLLQWEPAFDEWMKLNGFEKKASDHYQMNMNYWMTEGEMDVLIKVFNESAWMKYLKPVNAKMGDTKKITVDIFNTIKNYPYEESK